MTAKQKAARAKFKQVVAEAKKLRKKNPKLTQAQAVKQAWAIAKKVGAIKIIEKGESKKAKPKATYQQKRTKKGTYSGLKKVGAVKKKAAKKSVAKKSATKSSYHKDTKSHNVNIRVVSGIKRETGYIGKLIIKKYTLSEIKKLNPIYFEKGKDKFHGVYKRKLIVSPRLNSQVMIEAIKDSYLNKRIYSVRKITSEGKIENLTKFDSIFQAANYVGKNIIL